MPELSRFYGIIIRMYFQDHGPPHFHAEYQEHEAVIKITSANIVKDFVIRFIFSDGIQKEVDFKPFITKSDFTKPLLKKEYFKLMRVYENGRGVFWPNGYDFCPDNLRYFVGNEETEVLKHFAVHDKPLNTKDPS